MKTASSASVTWRAPRSASEKTAMLRIPSVRQVRMDPAGDLAATGNEEGFEHGSHIRKTGERPVSGGSAATMARHRPMTLRVSRGSRIPSSQSLAVA